MDSVIVIKEESHGFIGVARSMERAVEWCVNHEWITPLMDYYNESENESIPLYEALGLEKDTDSVEFINACLMEGRSFWENCDLFFKREKLI